MSKSKDNFISITESPHEIFRKIFELPNRLIPSYFMWLTELDNEIVNEIESLLTNGEVDSIALKTILGKAIVARLYSIEESEKSFASYMKETFRNTPTKDVKIVRGSIMNVCEMLSAATEYKFDEVCAMKHTAAIAVFDTEGYFVEYLDEGTKDIDAIALDAFYIKISDKVILRAIKR